jgi:hypothetical protein
MLEEKISVGSEGEEGGSTGGTIVDVDVLVRVVVTTEVFGGRVVVCVVVV